MFAALTTPEGIDAQIIVCKEVLRTMTGIEVAALSDAPSHAGRCINSTLYYRGTCDGALRLECGIGVASAFTSRMMCIPEPHQFDDDMKDALGELVNMIGGNLKGLLPAETTISSPMVSTMSAERSIAERQLTSIEFRCEFGWFRVRLYGEDIAH